MKGLILLLQFMTRIPTPKLRYDEKKLGKGMMFFPIIGMIIGGILLLATLFLNRFIGNTLIIAILLVVLEIALTGGLHLDGLADTFDGIFSYRSKKRMLEIMKDSRLGTNGALSLILYFGLKVALLDEILASPSMKYLILVMPVVGRFISVLNCYLGKYARPSGMGKALVEETNFLSIVVAIVLTIPFVYFFTGLVGIISLGILTILGGLFAKLMERKIGGVTGDTLGAVLEMGSVFFLLFSIIING